MSKCIECGGTRILLDGSRCPHCNNEEDTLEESLTVLHIPEQYRNIVYNKELVNKDVHPKYSEELYDLLSDIESVRMNKNYFIGSPINHSKKVFVYSCIQRLAKVGIQVFPYFDLGEIRRIMNDIDSGKKMFYVDEVEIEPELLYTSKYLFVKIPDTSYDTYDTLYKLLERRVRRGVYTIFLMDSTWKHLYDNDKKGIISSIAGDGSFCTVKNISYWKGEN